MQCEHFPFLNMLMLHYCNVNRMTQAYEKQQYPTPEEIHLKLETSLNEAGSSKMAATSSTFRIL